MALKTRKPTGSTTQAKGTHFVDCSKTEVTATKEVYWLTGAKTMEVKVKVKATSTIGLGVVDPDTGEFDPFPQVKPARRAIRP